MPQRTDIETLVLETVRKLAQDFDWESLKEPQADTALYGASGPLDSMGLVNLVSDLEDAVAEKYKTTISLADDKAMSAQRSPYRSIASLTDAVSERIHS